MAINIKNPEAEAALRQIAEILKIPMSQAAAQAFKTYRAQIQSAGQESLIEKWSRIGAENRARIGEEAAQHLMNYKEWLYDDNGLPK
jgi:hypothetical protein